jgi:hypothetical protein
MFSFFSENFKSLDTWKEKTEQSKLTLLGLIMAGQVEIQRRRERIERNDQIRDFRQFVKKFSFAKHVSKLAFGIYNSFAPFGGNNKIICFQRGAKHPDFAIVEDRQIKAFVLVVRGTFDAKDVVIDLDSEDSPLFDGHAHTGILIGSREILKKAKPILEEAFNREPSYKLVITGHSLGAGAAELITMMILLDKREFSSLARDGVRCVAFAPPPVYRSPRQLPDEVVSSIDIYINNYDCVPSLSLGVVVKLYTTMVRVDKLRFSPIEIGLILAGIGDMDRLIHAIETTDQHHVPYLHHPGTIFHLKESDNAYLTFRKSSEIFSRAITFRHCMVLDHLDDSYKAALAKVQADIERAGFFWTLYFFEKINCRN